MADTTGVLARLQAALSTYDPTWDVSVGTATYKILEAVAQEIAYANNNSVLQTYSYNINTKSSSELDAFCNLFGVYRQYGKRASGQVTFNVSGGATSIIDIPIGTQVAVPIGGDYVSPVYFSTTAPAIITVGQTSQDVPVIATLPGANGNVAAGTITSKVTTLNSITSVVNQDALTGGLDPESDVQLRARWQNTAFNNTTGTNGKYILTALQNPNVTSATAVGQQVFYDEQLQVQSTISGGTSNTVNFFLVAYSGMTNVITGSTYTTGTVVAYSGFPASTSGTVLASGLQSLYSTYAPGYNIGVTASGTTISGGLTVSLSAASPYRLLIGSGTTFAGIPIPVSGVYTASGTSWRSFIQSSNPDLGLAGTMSYNSTFSGYIFPQGNELVGSNLNTSSQTVYSPNVDYYYPSAPVPAPLNITIANGSLSPNLFMGNNVELISEYNPASSRSVTITSGNYVDIFINGTTAQSFTEQSVFLPSSMVLTSGNAINYLNTNNYMLASGVIASTVSVVANDYYIPLDRKPLVNFPSQLSVASSGVADTFTLYNTSTGSGLIIPIALNPYNTVTFTGSSAATGNTFISVTGANTFIYPGMALSSSAVTSGQPYYVSSVSSSGITMNYGSTATGTVTLTGTVLAYPLYDTTFNMNSVLDISGIAVTNGTLPSGWGTLPAVASWIQYTHDANNDVIDVEALVQQSRPLGVNTLVHQADFQYFNINVNIVFGTGYSVSTIQNSIKNQIKGYFNNIGYLGLMSFANLQTQILSVPGVANAKITSIDNVSIDGTKISGYSFTNDFILASNQLPLLNAINYTVKGASNF